MRASLIAVTVAGFLAACGGGEEATSTKDVVDHFRERTGEVLIRNSKLGGDDYEVLNLADIETDDGQLNERGLELADEYGAFSIYVADDKAKAEELVDGDGPDERGIYWERQTFDDPEISAAYGAEKLYGNVMLYWQGGEHRGTDRTWERLNSILEDLE
jgi:hypothetical protein